MSSDHLPARTPSQRPMQSLRAAAHRITSKKIKRTPHGAWQDEAWDLYDEVGELRFTANAQGSALSRSTLFVGEVVAAQTDPIAVEEKPLITEAFASMAGGPLQSSELIRRLSIQLFVAGDGYLVGIPPESDEEPSGDDSRITPVGQDLDGPGLAELTWHALSVSEVKLRAGKIELMMGSESTSYDEDEIYLIRVWRPHPRHWWSADSPVRANLPVLRELVGLTKHVGASIDSRLAGAGLLLVPDSIRVSAAQQSGQPDDDGGQDDPFVEALIESMVTPIRDRDSASAVVPLVATVPEDVLDKIKHLQFSTAFDATALSLREEAIRRLALGLDIPPELLLGMGGSNHWSAWQIEESTVKTHIEPVLALICDALTTDYLWPVLEAAGVQDYERYVIWFDTTDLTLRPNRAAEAQALHAAGALTDEALRREAGFDEADAPPPMDRAVEIALKLAQDSPGLMVDPGLPTLITMLRDGIESGKAAAAVEEDESGATPPDPLEGDEVVDTGVELPDTQGEVPSDPMLAGSR